METLVLTSRDKFFPRNIKPDNYLIFFKKILDTNLPLGQNLIMKKEKEKALNSLGKLAESEN